MTARSTHGAKTDYPAIGSMAALGDGQSLALVAPDGALEWFCPGRFDHAPLVWPLLDRQRGGRLKIGPSGAQSMQMRYVDHTAVLIQKWQCAQGCAEGTVCMEWPAAVDRQYIFWMIEGTEGMVEVSVDVDPKWGLEQSGLAIKASRTSLEMRADQCHLVFRSACSIHNDGSSWSGRLTLHAGERVVFYLALTLQGDPADPPSPQDVKQRIDATTQAWRAWSSKLAWQGRYGDAVIRSAITLKLLIYQPTGAVVAAGTTSLPEDIGGERNWDYRFTWFRDASMTLAALFALGCADEAHCWARWLNETIKRQGLPLRILYDVDGELPPAERVLPEVEGYRQSRPVRTGNGATFQHQLDIYGELLQCVHICDTMADDSLHAYWPYMRATADFIATHWRKPDSGIWEIRTEPRHFVHSKVMAWAGLQRALWLQARHGLQADVAKWRHESDQLHEEVMRLGVSRDGTHFVRAYGEDGLDAGLLLLARSGFIDARSELFRNTVAAIRKTLGVKGQAALLRRYHVDDPDGLRGQEGAFVICGFWLVEALIMMGERSEAQALFDELLALQGQHGLFAEEIDVHTLCQLGNFPQAFSHIGLINTALKLRHEDQLPGSSPRSSNSTR